MTNLAPNPLPREMLIRIMQNLWNLKGSKQYIDIATLPDKDEAQKKLDGLLMPMIRTLNSFNYIPLKEIEGIIEEAIIRDPEFYGLNAGKVWQYLNGVAGQYFKQEAHQKTEEESRESNARPLTNEEIDVWIKRIQDAIQQAGDKAKCPPMTQEQIQELGKEKLEKKAVTVARPEWIIGEPCPQCKGTGVTDTKGDFEISIADMCGQCKGAGEINLKRVHADTEEEARKMYAYHKAHAK